jgi:fido (protein-threonine AMPylation protein)
MTGTEDEPEGASPIDPDEIDGLKFKHITMRDELNELEQANVESGLLWLGRRRKSDILTEKFTLDLSSLWRCLGMGRAVSQDWQEHRG